MEVLDALSSNELPLGAIKPLGWYKDLLRLQADNFSGVLDDHWDSVGRYSGWLGGTGDDWERGPYYLDGLYPLASLLDDRALIDKAWKWVEWTLNSQRENGDFGPGKNKDYWPRMVMLKVLMQYHEATSDERVLVFMDRYAEFLIDSIPTVPLSDWSKARGGELILWLYWLYERRQKLTYLVLAKVVYGQTLDWYSFFIDFPLTRATSFYLDWESIIAHYKAQEIIRLPQFLFSHVVNVAMGLKTATLYSRQSHDPLQKNSIKVAIDHLMRYHGVANHLFTGDEHLDGRGPSQGTELCAVVEYMFSLESVLGYFDTTWAVDSLEVLAFNGLASTISADFRSHQYLQQANQVEVSRARRKWFNNNEESNLFGLEPNFGCCTANLHQGWPKLAKACWRTTHDGGLAAFVYAPTVLETFLPQGGKIKIITRTQYPFDEDVFFTIHTDSKSSFPLKFRIPSWCQGAMLETPYGIFADNEPGTWTEVRAAWKNGDAVRLRLPMVPSCTFWEADSVNIEYGPLIFALQMDERWNKIGGYSAFPDWEITSPTPWNYALGLDKNRRLSDFEVIKVAVPENPFSFSSGAVPLRLRIPARRVPAWAEADDSAGPVPGSPQNLAALSAEEHVDLIPYGFTRLRIAQFPWYFRQPVL